MLALDKSQVARQFSRAASGYQQVSDIQNRMADRLLDLVPEQLAPPSQVVDLGCGAGYLTGLLADRYVGSNILGLDIAEGMLKASGNYFRGRGLPKNDIPELVYGDMESLPLRSNVVDLVFSNAALQWTDCDQSLAEIFRILAPGGLAMLTTFIEGTLAEWQPCLNANGLDGVHQLQSMDDLISAAQCSGADLILSDTHTYQIGHNSAQAMLESTKRMGATNAQRERRQGLMGRQLYQNLIRGLEQEFLGREYYSTYQVGFLILKKSV
jgi:malonyl-CoA O-methyltransferase